MKIELTNNAVQWIKDELDLPEDGKVLQFFVRYGGEIQLKPGFSPAFNVEPESDIDEVGFEETYDAIRIVIAEKDLWYYEDHNIQIDVNDDEIIYHADAINQ
ncbi:HesB/YadR/YfhF family protein [Staphylococcus lutrae]|uniref:FeS cluster biogenesis domain-containing protein n=1 Tax=Staphylococcus lutrae TaxID=155085 RepID=A0AAC9RTZ4_9STAP|nr:hypothetical protein [Staphylococcus lutrae]ARJ51799.1 hypothetical protein B5P37_10970 [Staphylococcus lutrae]PNZ36039.1 hypothetical protein CD134_08250 [Staphylococcus lutrae]